MKSPYSCRLIFFFIRIIRIHSYIGIGCLLSLAALSQTPKADSLLHALQNADIDTTKIKLLNDLAWELKYSNPDTAITLSKQALSIINVIATPGAARGKQSANMKQWLQQSTAIIYHNLGVFNRLKGTYDTALTLLNNALEIWEKLEKTLPENRMVEILKSKSSTIGTIGNVYHEQGAYPKALHHYDQALEIDKEFGNKISMARHISSIGIVYANQGAYPKALDHYNQALEIDKELGNKKGMAIRFGNIGDVYYYQDAYPKALLHYNHALEIFKELENKWGIATLLGNIGNLYSELGTHAKDAHNQDSLYVLALEQCSQSLQISKEIGDREGIALLHTSIASRTSLKTTFFSPQRRNDAKKKIINALKPILCVLATLR